MPNYTRDFGPSLPQRCTRLGLLTQSVVQPDKPPGQMVRLPFIRGFAWAYIDGDSSESGICEYGSCTTGVRHDRKSFKRVALPASSHPLITASRVVGEAKIF